MKFADHFYSPDLDKDFHVTEFERHDAIQEHGKWRVNVRITGFMKDLMSRATEAAFFEERRFEVWMRGDTFVLIITQIEQDRLNNFVRLRGECLYREKLILPVRRLKGKRK